MRHARVQRVERPYRNVPLLEPENHPRKITDIKPTVIAFSLHYHYTRTMLLTLAIERIFHEKTGRLLAERALFRNP